MSSWPQVLLPPAVTGARLLEHWTLLPQAHPSCPPVGPGCPRGELLGPLRRLAPRLPAFIRITTNSALRRFLDRRTVETFSRFKAVIIALRHSMTRKSPGPSGVPLDLFKDNIVLLAPILTNVFKASISGDLINM
ncbi:hypothetical protein NDU88_000734 [Pleurodeles waltl]|uniref:Uncharacterized protein n=1 Tax=Pleurodeles waltl TaxID=8319 RepID=A0AAV7S7U3_PLEWA|nr:hypothetical protein NDU88_000734 [Pleurodeles waltl]